MISRAIWPLSAVLMTACATLPTTGTPATGERLSVDSRVLTHQWVEQAKVGEVVHKDSSGRRVGTSDVYEDRLRTSQELVWKPMQGMAPIDDEDFFRIAGDEEGLRQVRGYREIGLWLNRGGLGAAAVGVVGMVVGLALAKAVPEGGGGAPATLLGGGLILTSLGATVAYMGAGRLSPQTHPLAMERAQQAAATYNARIGAQSARPASGWPSARGATRYGDRAYAR